MRQTFNRDDVRLLLAQQRQRLLTAKAEGNFLAVANDITDELNGIIAGLLERDGKSEAFRFKYLYSEAQREAALEGQAFHIPGMTDQPNEFTQPQLQPPERQGPSWKWLVLGAIIALLIFLALG